MEEDIKTNIRFISICDSLGLDSNNSKIINFNNNYIIINHIPNSNIYILFDKDYNIFGIENFNNINSFLEISKKVLFIYNCYSNTPDDITPFKFPYPFENYTLKDIIELGNKVNITDLYNNISIIKDKDKEIKLLREIRLLSYLKFLSMEINKYFIYIYKMKLLNIDIPNIYLYVISLINKINSLSDNILSNIGENTKHNNLSYLASSISKLLVEEKKNNSKDLDILANNLLNKVPSESFEKILKIYLTN